MSEEKTVEEKIEEQKTVEDKVEEQKPVEDKTVEQKVEEDKTVEEMDLDFDEDTIPPKRLFGSHKEDMNFLRDKWILSRISNKDLMEYLRLEQKRNDQLMEAKEKKSKRLFAAFQLTVSLIAAVLVVYFLKDNPTILVNILYIVGILVGFWIWKKNQK